MSRRPSLLSCFSPWRGEDGLPQHDDAGCRGLPHPQLKNAQHVPHCNNSNNKPEAAPRAVAETTEAPSGGSRDSPVEEGALDLLVLCGSAPSLSEPHHPRSGAPEEGSRAAHLRLVAPEDLVCDMQLGRLLGCGPTSSVHKGMWQGAKVACKFMVVPELTPAINEALTTLLNQSLSHPYLLQYYLARATRLTPQLLASLDLLDALPAAGDAGPSPCRRGRSNSCMGVGAHAHGAAAAAAAAAEAIGAGIALSASGFTSGMPSAGICVPAARDGCCGWQSPSRATAHAQLSGLSCIDLLDHSCNNSVYGSDPRATRHYAAAAASSSSSTGVLPQSGSSIPCVDSFADLDSSIVDGECEEDNASSLRDLARVVRYLRATPGHYLIMLVPEHCCMGDVRHAIRQGVFGASHRWSAGVGQRAALRTAREVVLALCHLHSLGHSHGRVCAANVLMSESHLDKRGFCVKVSDSRLSPAVPPPASNKVSYGCGVPLHVGPADVAAAGMPAASPADDIRSVGVLLYEMLTATHLDLQAVGMASGTGLAWPPGIHPDIMALVSRCVAHQADKRPNAAQLAAEMLRVDARMRGGATHLQHPDGGSSAPY